MTKLASIMLFVVAFSVLFSLVRVCVFLLPFHLVIQIVFALGFISSSVMTYWVLTRCMCKPSTKP